MGNLNNIDSASGIVQLVQLHLPPIFSTQTSSLVYKFFLGVAQIFKINLDYLEELYSKTKVYLASGSALNEVITDMVNIFRQDGESDEDYIDRYIKRVYRYNSTVDSLKDQVYDITGIYPDKMYELNTRSSYWGKANVQNDNAIHSFYDNSADNASFWGSGNRNGAFKGYIILSERPTSGMLIELRNLINSNRLTGTKIYLKYPSPITLSAPITEAPSGVNYDSFIAVWS